LNVSRLRLRAACGTPAAAQALVSFKQRRRSVSAILLLPDFAARGYPLVSRHTRADSEETLRSFRAS
jgi:hypothetical protein